MKLNKFVQVAIPKNSEFFSRLAGNMPKIPDGFFSGDSDIPEGMRKTEILQRVDKMEMNEIRREAAEAAEAARKAEEDK